MFFILLCTKFPTLKRDSQCYDDIFLAIISALAWALGKTTKDNFQWTDKQWVEDGGDMETYAFRRSVHEEAEGHTRRLLRRYPQPTLIEQGKAIRF